MVWHRSVTALRQLPRRALRSAPAQNAGPLPVMTMQRTSSSAFSIRWSYSSVTKIADRALRLSSLFNDQSRAIADFVKGGFGSLMVNLFCQGDEQLGVIDLVAHADMFLLDNAVSWRDMRCSIFVDDQQIALAHFCSGADFCCQNSAGHRRYETAAGINAPRIGITWGFLRHKITAVCVYQPLYTVLLYLKLQALPIESNVHRPVTRLMDRHRAGYVVTTTLKLPSRWL